MAEKYYRLQEVMKKLKTDQKGIRKIVDSGKLTQFHDGKGLIYRVQEVDELAKSIPKESEEIPLVPPEDLKADKVKLDSSLTGEEEGTSGSGLLDLAKEADETSVGADVLREIYPKEKPEQQPPISKEKIGDSTAVNLLAEQTPGESKSAVETMPDKTTAIPPEELIELEEAVSQITAAEPKSDLVANALGIGMTIPLVMLVLLSCAMVATLKDYYPLVLERTAEIIWHLVIGAGILVLCIWITGELFVPKLAKRK